MEMQQPGSLLDFMGAEHTNELVSVHKFGAHLEILQHIDGLLRAPVSDIDVPANLHAVAQLYLFMHYNLYASVANLMRLHVGEALGCQRRAIDATLSAYEMIENPTSAPEYETGAYKFKFIQRFISKARNKDTTRYPLAVELLKTWEQCSAFGAHADAQSFGLRMKKVKMAGVENKHKLFFLYFEQPQTEDESHFFFTDTLVNFLNMARVFAPFVQQYAPGFAFNAWSQKLDQLDTTCRAHWKELADKMEAAEQQQQQQ